MSKKVSALITMSFVTALFFILLPFVDSISANQTEIYSIPHPNHEFTITFSDEVKNNVENLNKIYIRSESGEKQSLSINVSTDPTKVIVKSKNPYIFGEIYTLVIPKGVESVKGEKTEKEVTQPFQVEGTYIQSIDVNYTSFLSEIKVFVNDIESIQRVVVTLENGSEIDLHKKYGEFSRGMMGLLPGDLLKIEAYDSTNKIVETQYVKVKN
ncbi:MAG: hypothetical protein GX072_08670 [Lysinibacillus sp.]|nr:hypothetical protein [Lysinibacillus sp.]